MIFHKLFFAKFFFPNPCGSLIRPSVPGPTDIYSAYTPDELTAELANLKAEIAGGTIASLGGAAKSSTITRMPVADRMKALLWAMRRAGMQPPRGQKVVQILNRGCDPFPGAIAGGCFP